MSRRIDKAVTSMSITFPDVCKMPGPPAPFVPVPYPNIGKSPGRPYHKRAPGGRPLNQAQALTQRARMSSLHSQIQALPPDATAQQWQDLLEQYLLAASAMFKAQRGS